MILFFACIASFFAGFVDSIAGGGGLIQVPALLFLFPNVPIVTLLGTNKLAMSSGTVISSLHYTRALKVDFKVFLPAIIVAFISSILGAKVLSIMDNEILKPLVFILLILIAIYTFIKKDLGVVSNKKFSGWQLQCALILIGAMLGFYDGFFGPGTGSFLMFCCVSLLGFSFLEGSAFAKMTNLAANVSALIFFSIHGHVMFKIGLPMAVCNITGNYFGARLAIKKGSGFVRWIFLVVVGGMIAQFIPHLLRF